MTEIESFQAAVSSQWSESCVSPEWERLVDFTEWIEDTLFRRLVSWVSGPHGKFYVSDSDYEDEPSELSKPDSRPKTITEAVFQCEERRFDVRATVKNVVQPHVS